MFCNEFCVFVVSKQLFFLVPFYGKFCFVWVSAAQNVTVLFFCLHCLTRCVSLTKLCLSKSAMTHADLSASGATATYEYTGVCPSTYFANYWVCNVSVAPIRCQWYLYALTRVCVSTIQDVQILRHYGSHSDAMLRILLQDADSKEHHLYTASFSDQR